jgi:hypothetical protein
MGPLVHSRQLHAAQSVCERQHARQFAEQISFASQEVREGRVAVVALSVGVSGYDAVPEAQQAEGIRQVQEFTCM